MKRAAKAKKKQVQERSSRVASARRNSSPVHLPPQDLNSKDMARRTCNSRQQANVRDQDSKRLSRCLFLASGRFSRTILGFPQCSRRRAARAVQPELSSGSITVGTRIEVDHLKAVALGSTVRAHARLVGHEGRFLVFEVEARSGQRVIGRGRVFRAILEPAKFATAAEEQSK